MNCEGGLEETIQSFTDNFRWNLWRSECSKMVINFFWQSLSLSKFTLLQKVSRMAYIPSTGDQWCSQLIVATLVPSTPICSFFNLAKLQCKQTVVTDFCIGFVNKIHIIGKGMIKETWNAKIKEIGCWTEELITFCPFSPVSVWSEKLPNFAVKHVDLSWDFGHDVPWMGRCIDVNNEGGLDTRPSSLYWQIAPGVFLA